MSAMSRNSNSDQFAFGSFNYQQGNALRGLGNARLTLTSQIVTMSFNPTNLFLNSQILKVHSKLPNLAISLTRYIGSATSLGQFSLKYIFLNLIMCTYLISYSIDSLNILYIFHHLFILIIPSILQQRHLLSWDSYDHNHPEIGILLWRNPPMQTYHLQPTNIN